MHEIRPLVKHGISPGPGKAHFYLAILTVFLPIFPLHASSSLRVDPDRREVHVPAVAHPDRFQKPSSMAGYHFLVWDKGRAADSALFTTPVSDSTLYEALHQLGGTPGDGLDMNTWEERKNPNHPAPDKKITGSGVQILVTWSDQPDGVPLSYLLSNPGGKGFDFRFGGHLENIPIWKSGCGVCLYSCPGSKIGNASYTVRDYVKKTTQFRIRPDRFPKPGTPVSIIFRLVEEPPTTE